MCRTFFPYIAVSTRIIILNKHQENLDDSFGKSSHTTERTGNTENQCSQDKCRHVPDMTKHSSETGGQVAQK